jgi:predicted acyltransferase (DUF342 family)
MALTSLTKDFITRSGLAVEGLGIATTATYTNGLNTGTFQVAGGAGIQKNLIVGSTATIYGITYLNNQLVVNSSATVATTLYVTGISTLNGVVVPNGSTLIASGGQTATGPNNSTGALQVTGGAGISGNLYVGGTTYLTGDLYVDGTQFVVNSQSLNAGEKALVLSTGSTSAIVATGAGIYIGVSSGTAYTSFYYDGVNSWIIPNGAAGGGLKVQGVLGASTTNSGALQVVGGVGIGGGLFVGAVITATNINAILGTATNPGNIYGGNPGQLLYQSAGSTTGFVTSGTAGYILTSNGPGNAPTWTNPTAVAATSATNLVSNASQTYDIPYQSGVNQTAFSSSLIFNPTGYNGATGLFTTTNVSITGGNNATAATGNSGSLMVQGGVGISQDLWVGGDLDINGTIYMKGIGLDTISSTTGTFVNARITGTGVAVTVPNGSVSIGANLIVASQASFNGGLTATVITATTANITGNQTVGGSLTVTGNITATIITATTLAVTNNQTVGGSVVITGNLTATNITATNLTLSGSVQQAGILVNTATQISGAMATVYGGAYIAGLFTATTANITGNQTVGGSLTITGNVTATIVTATSLSVSGNENIGGSLIVTGNVTATIVTATSLSVSGNENIGGSLTVTGNITATNITATSITVSNLTNNGNFNVSGSISATGNLTATIITATSIAVSGNETIGGSLVVTGNVQATVITATTLVLTGNETEQGTLSITNVVGTTSTNTGALQVVGGVGINGGLFVGGTVTATNIIATNATIQNLTLGAPLSFTNITTTNIVVTGQETVLNLLVTGTNVVSGVSTFSNTVNVTDPTNATNTTTGAIRVVGGVGVGRDVQVGGTVFAGVNTSGTTATTVVALQSNAFQEASYISQVLGSGQNGVEQYLDTLSTATYRSAEYTVQITDFPKIHIGKLLLMHDGTNNIYLSEFGVVTNSGTLGTFDAAFTGTNVVLKFTPTSAPTAMTIKVRRTAITI